MHQIQIIKSKKNALNRDYRNALHISTAALEPELIKESLTLEIAVELLGEFDADIVENIESDRTS